MKIEVEIEDGIIPEGYEVVRIGLPKNGESYATKGEDEGYCTAYVDFEAAVCAIIRKKQLSYQERQDAWIKEHGIKVGSKVRVLRKVSNDGEDGWDCGWNSSMDDSVGGTLTVCEICNRKEDTRGLRLADGWWYPYFALEPVKKPEYVPYTFETMPVEGIKVKHTIHGTFHVVEPVSSGVVGFRNSAYSTTYGLLFKEYTLLDGTPCGVKVGE